MKNNESRNRFDDAITKRIKLKSLTSRTPFVPRDSAINQYIETALTIFHDDGKLSLKEEEYNSACQNLAAAREILQNLDINKSIEPHLGKLLEISKETSGAFFKVAASKFKQREFEQSYSLFIFLTLLLPESYDCWYRLGIAAQQAEHYAEALRAYAVALSFKADLFEARIFSIECSLKLGQQADAEAELKEAQNLIQTHPNPAWTKLFEGAKTLLHSRHHS